MRWSGLPADREGGDRLVGGILIGAIAGTVAWVDPGFSTSNEAGKRGFLIAAALLLGWVAMRRPWTPLPRCLHLLALSDLLMRLCATALALHPWPAALGGSERGLGLLDASAWWVLVYAAAACATRASWQGPAGAILLLAGGLALLPWTSSFGGRPHGSFGNPAFMAGALAIAAPLLWCLPGLTGRVRALLLCTLGLLLLATLARAALLAAVAGVGVAAWLQSPRWHRLGIAAAALAATALLVGWISLGAQRGPSVSLRLGIYQSAVTAPLAAEPLVDRQARADPHHRLRPWIGHGPEGVEAVLTRWRPASMNALEARGWDRLADRSHNRLLDRWLEFGGPGVLLGLLLAVVPLAVLLRSRQAPTALGAGAAGAWVAFGIDGAFSVPSAVVDLGGALALGLLAAAARAPAEAPGTGRPAVLATLAVLLLGPLCGIAHRALLWGPEAWRPGATITASLRTQPYSALPALEWLELARTLPQAPARQALELAEHAVRAAPANPRAWHQLAHWRRHLGADADAQRADLESLLLLAEASEDPALQARAAIAVLGHEQRSALWLARARRLLEGIPLPARAPGWHRNHAYAAALLGDRATAIASYRAALRQDPQDVASRRNLARLEAATESTQ